MRLCKDLLDKPIITISDGRIVGQAKDLLLTTDLKTMAGILLGREGFIRRRSKLIPSQSVEVFGIDAILIKQADAVVDDREMKEAAGWIRLSKLLGREVDTPGGTRVGTIGDVLLDEEGHVAGFALSRVYVEGPISDKRLISHAALIDTGNEDGIMTIRMEVAEGHEPAAAPPAPEPVIEEAEAPATLPQEPTSPPALSDSAETPAPPTPDQE